MKAYCSFMCKRSRPRFLCLFHRMVMDDLDNIPLDSWMDANVPEHYRVVSVMMDKMITDQIIFNYTVVMELRDDDHHAHVAEPHDPTFEIAPMDIGAVAHG